MTDIELFKFLRTHAPSTRDRFICYLALDNPSISIGDYFLTDSDRRYYAELYEKVYQNIVHRFQVAANQEMSITE